ncbi:right-handed parallel beta-helix repeat-containing protein [Flavivirga eckloniae]|uniref:Right handed beta helix domain-containing protein n=1 Tax=Flavivirga eckloniae TaxID=1803846 RepID=A0A2K9PL39_9FLAO|nr:hypothetical protein [Flavivirga eckloniae]AUP77783.1 hypothetical protein C1H87_03250 [Flavivirga eckloniae]
MSDFIKILSLSIFILLFQSISSQSFINDLATLQNYSGNDFVHLNGYFEEGDCGSGHFVLKETNLQANGGTIFNSPNPNKKWCRVYEGAVNSKWFKSDNIISDRKAISNAIRFAEENKTVYIPAGNYDLKDEFIEINKPLNITGDKDLTLLLVQDFHMENATVVKTFQSVFKVRNSDVSISNLKIKGDRISGISIETPKDSSITKNISVSNVTFEGVENLNHCIHLYTCSSIKITDCRFMNTEYQIIQQWYHSSNDVLVNNCISDNCDNDFIELNSETGAPSKNWVITNNNVRNVGITLADTTRTESRFIGVTNTDGIVIANNVIENIGGDSVFHFEKHTGKVIISNNIIRNPHGKFGRLIFNVGSDSVPTSKRNINFTNNYIEITDNRYVDDADMLIYSSDIDSTKITLRDNTFINDSPDNNLNVLVKAYSKTLWKIVGNEFENFNSAVKIGQDAGHTIINENLFLNVENAIETTNLANSKTSVSINNNSFENVNHVLKNDYGITVQKFASNTIKNSTLNYNNDFAGVFEDNIFIDSNNNISRNSITNYKNIQIEDVVNGVPTTIFEIPDKNYSILCWVEISNGSANRVKDLIKFSRHYMLSNPETYGEFYEVLSHYETGNWPLPNYEVNEIGLNATITGSDGNNFKTKVSIISVEN